jgi:hypothetical protein
MKIITEVCVSKLNGVINTYKAVWDTGADETLISDKIANDLKLEQNGEVEVRTLNSRTISKRYNCLMLFDGHNSSINLTPASFPIRPDFDIIIGMDLISLGIFVLDKGKLSFTIEQLK